MSNDRLGTILCIIFLTTCVATALYNGSIKSTKPRERPVTRFQLDSLQHAYDSLVIETNTEFVRTVLQYEDILKGMQERLDSLER
jgi:hypothetical protein